MEPNKLGLIKDGKKLEMIKEGKRQIVEGSLTIWNARMEALAELGYDEDFINHLGSPADDVMWKDVCGCGGGSPICNCKKCDGLGIFDHSIYEMSQKINEIGKEISVIKEKLK